MSPEHLLYPLVTQFSNLSFRFHTNTMAFSLPPATSLPPLNMSTHKLSVSFTQSCGPLSNHIPSSPTGPMAGVIFNVTSGAALLANEHGDFMRAPNPNEAVFSTEIVRNQFRTTGLPAFVQGLPHYARHHLETPTCFDSVVNPAELEVVSVVTADLVDHATIADLLPCHILASDFCLAEVKSKPRGRNLNPPINLYLVDGLGNPYVYHRLQASTTSAPVILCLPTYKILLMEGGQAAVEAKYLPAFLQTGHGMIRLTGPRSLVQLRHTPAADVARARFLDFSPIQESLKPFISLTLALDPAYPPESIMRDVLGVAGIAATMFSDVPQVVASRAGPSLLRIQPSEARCVSFCVGLDMIQFPPTNASTHRSSLHSIRSLSANCPVSLSFCRLLSEAARSNSAPRWLGRSAYGSALSMTNLCRSCHYYL
jgi:hypothetical protein